MRKINMNDLPALLRQISESQDLYVPVKTAGQVSFGTYSEEAEVSIETLKTVKSPKGVFFPQSEDMYTVIRAGKKIKIEPESLADHDFVLFGVKACDIRGFQVLDKVFLSDPVDSFYAARREHGIVVGLACTEPAQTCFCKVFDIDAADPSKGWNGDTAGCCTEGMAADESTGDATANKPACDVNTWIIDGVMYWQSLTEKGNRLTAQLSENLGDIFAEADSMEEQGSNAGAKAENTKNAGSAWTIVSAEKIRIAERIDALPYSDLTLEGWGADALYDRFNSQVWDDLYKPCLACGTCTFVCPTCQCYDIKDYDTGHGVKRYRCWDSCMYSDFTLMAAVNNRKSQKERFRQRFMHKLAYYPVNNDGLYSCVGCGRCVAKCPQNLNIIKVIKAFQKENGSSAVPGDTNAAGAKEGK